MKKILVPTDFSEIAKNAFDFALQLARKVDAEILLVHAIELDYGSFVASGEVLLGEFDIHYQAELIKGSELRIEELLTGIDDVTVRSKLVIDDAEEAIKRMIDKNNVDLVVMGSKGAKGLKELLVGSHTEKIIRRASCPVITIKGKTELSELQTIMFATDLSEETIKTANIVREFQELLDLDLEMLCIKKEYLNLESAEVEQKMIAYIERTKIHDCGLNVLTANSIEDGIQEAAERINAGIIAMGTHGRDGVMHFFVGSHTENVANHSTKPLLSINMKNN